MAKFLSLIKKFCAIIHSCNILPLGGAGVVNEVVEGFADDVVVGVVVGIVVGVAVGIVVGVAVEVAVGVVVVVAIVDTVGAGSESGLFLGMRTAKRMITRRSDAAPTMLRIFAVLYYKVIMPLFGEVFSFSSQIKILQNTY